MHTSTGQVYWTIAQAVEQLGISEKTIRRRINRGQIKASKVGGVYMIPSDQSAELDQAHDQGQQSGQIILTRDRLDGLVAAIVQPMVDAQVDLARQLERSEQQRKAAEASLDRYRTNRWHRFVDWLLGPQID